jgi:hypothetical protein
MRKKETKQDVKTGKEKILNGKFWVDPMCGPVRQ